MFDMHGGGDRDLVVEAVREVATKYFAEEARKAGKELKIDTVWIEEEEVGGNYIVGVDAKPVIAEDRFFRARPDKDSGKFYVEPVGLFYRSGAPDPVRERMHRMYSSEDEASL